MFNTTHILYMVISAVISAGTIIALRLFKNKRANKAAIWFLAIITVIIHFSGLWYEFFTVGEAQASTEYILPVYPCHICMWLLVISATVLEREDPVSKTVKGFSFWGGLVCGSVGLIFNENFGSNPTLADYHVLKGLLSHSTMILGCILLFSAGFVKIRVKRSVFDVAAGLTLFILDGWLVNSLFKKYGLGECNAMYMQKAPFEALPFINVYTIGVAALLVTFIASAIYEQIQLPPDKRWYAPLLKGNKCK